MPTIANDFKVEMAVNESIINAQSIKVLIRKPNTISFVEKDPTSVDNVNNIIKYDVTTAFNDIAGEWVFKVVIVNSYGLTSTSTSESIIVDESI